MSKIILFWFGRYADGTISVSLLSINYKMPADAICMDICDALSKPGVIRDHLTHLCYIGEGEQDPTGLMEQAFIEMRQAQPQLKAILLAQREGKISRKVPMEQAITEAEAAGIVTAEQAEQLHRMNKLRFEAISVDSFKAGEL